MMSLMAVLTPPPVELLIASHLGVDEAARQLIELGNGGPAGSLKAKVGPDSVVAYLLSESPSKFRGQLSAKDHGCHLAGLVHASRVESVRLGMFAAGAVILVLSALAMLASRAGGDVGVAWAVLLASACGCALFFVGLRYLLNRSFPVEANRLNRALATALEAELPRPARPTVSGRASMLILAGVLGLQAAVFGMRAVAGGGSVLEGGAWGIGFLGMLPLLVLAVRWSQPRLLGPTQHGPTVRVGWRRVQLDSVVSVRARGGLLALSDGLSRVVVSSALGRPERLDDEPAPDPGVARQRSWLTGSTAEERQTLARAVQEVVQRCPLDPKTAATLHRPPTTSSPTMASPKVDPQSLATLVALALALAMLIGIVTVVH